MTKIRLSPLNNALISGFMSAIILAIVYVLPDQQRGIDASFGVFMTPFAFLFAFVLGLVLGKVSTSIERKKISPSYISVAFWTYLPGILVLIYAVWSYRRV